MDAKGTLYSMRNSTLRGENTRKIGFTKRHVKKRLSEANSETYSLPEWEVEFAKEVDNVIEAEKKVHSLLESLGMRMYPNYPRKEFFQVPRVIIKAIFDLVPGTYYSVTDPLPSEPVVVEHHDTGSEGEIEVEIEGEVEGENEDIDGMTGPDEVGVRRAVAAPKRDMREYLTDGMNIRHRLINNDEWIGVYNRTENMISRGDSVYNTPTAFANDHNVQVLGGISNQRSGWNECFAQLANGEWKRLKKLEML